MHTLIGQKIAERRRIMKRSELEHLIRAAGSIADDTEIVVIGSQVIFGLWDGALAW